MRLFVLPYYTDGGESRGFPRPPSPYRASRVQCLPQPSSESSFSADVLSRGGWDGRSRPFTFSLVLPCHRRCSRSPLGPGGVRASPRVPFFLVSPPSSLPTARRPATRLRSKGTGAPVPMPGLVAQHN